MAMLNYQRVFGGTPIYGTPHLDVPCATACWNCNEEMSPEATTAIRQCLSEAWPKHGKNTLGWRVS